MKVEKVRSIFASNGYPHNFFNKVLQKNISSRSVSTRSELNESRLIDNDFRFLIKLLFLGKAS